MRRSACLCLIVALTAGVSFTFAGADDEEKPKPKHAIKDVMKVAHKDGLLKKVSAGDASKEDRVALLDLYISLTENKPKKGEAASWTAKTNAIVLAAAKVAVGRKGAEEALKKATNCGACHSKHK